eukprot:SAG11_NODE_181_length_13239_cov_10.587139_1_plen_245_part_10
MQCLRCAHEGCERFRLFLARYCIWSAQREAAAADMDSSTQCWVTTLCAPVSLTLTCQKSNRRRRAAIPELGSKIAMVFSPLTVPVLANRFGWRAVALTYGAGCGLLGTLWHACAADAPSEWRQVEAGRSAALISLPPMNAAERRLFAPGGDGGSEGKKAGGLIPRYLLRAPAAYAPVLAHICDCLTVICRSDEEDDDLLPIGFPAADLAVGFHNPPPPPPPPPVGVVPLGCVAGPVSSSVWSRWY